MTVNINAASISSARFAEQASAPATPAAGFVRLYANNATLPLLSMVNDAGTVTSYLGNSSGSGTGITFPATQSPSSDANTLDDYEEGTWTPTIVGSGIAGAGTYTLQQGAYTKIGRMVIQTFAIDMIGHSGTGNMRVANLLFPAGAFGRGGAFITYVTNITLTPGNYISGMYLNSNSSLVTIWQTPTGGGAATEVALDTSCSLYGVIIAFV